MPHHNPPPHQSRYRHFVMCVWEECNGEGQHVTWRFSLQDPHQEARVGFKNLKDLAAYLERWMETPTKDHSDNS